MTPVFSVVIPTYGKRVLLERTLHALAEQDMPAEQWNVVIVDDGSPDDTAQYLATMEQAWGPRLVVVSPEVNVGRARARNLGAARATGDWILFLDDDVVAPTNLLSAHRDILEGNPLHGTIGLVRTDPQLVDAPHFHYIDTRGVAKTLTRTVPAKYLVTQNTAVPRAAFQTAGGFDEAFTAYGFEDGDLGFRLEQEGVVFRPLREPIPVHVHHHTFSQWIDKKRECGHGPLQRMALSWPERLPELAVDWIVDRPGDVPGLITRSMRWGARSVLAPMLKGMMPSWPTGKAHRPLMMPLYALLMNVLVLSAFCQGVADTDTENGILPDNRQT